MRTNLKINLFQQKKNKKIFTKKSFLTDSAWFMVKLSLENVFFWFKKFAFFTDFIDINKLRNDSLSLFLSNLNF